MGKRTNSRIFLILPVLLGLIAITTLGRSITGAATGAGGCGGAPQTEESFDKSSAAITANRCITRVGHTWDRELKKCIKTPAKKTVESRTSQLSSYLNSLRNRTEKKIIFGTFYGNQEERCGPIASQDDNVRDNEAHAIYSEYGIWPAAEEAMYSLGWSDGSIVSPNAKTVTSGLIERWNRGSIISVVHSPRNPFPTGGQPGNKTGKDPWTHKDIGIGTATSWADVYTPGTEANTSFLADLDLLAVEFQTLKEAGVPVVFRPFAEFTGGHFWWGTEVLDQTTRPTPGEFARLWRYTHDYFTQTKGLTNILWNWCMHGSSDVEPEHYPGGTYVDIVGFTFYGGVGGVEGKDTVNVYPWRGLQASLIRNYKAAEAYNKPIFWSEFGVGISGNSATAWPTYSIGLDIRAQLDWINVNMPYIVYMSQWGAHYGVLTDAALLDSRGDPKLFSTVVENSSKNSVGIQQDNLHNGFGMFESEKFLNNPLLLGREELIDELTNEWLASDGRFSPYCNDGAQ